ncbi:universal stress protein [Shimia sp. W99]
MSIKNILVAYGGESTRSAALKYAINVTKYHDGFLTGVVRHGTPAIQRRFAGQVPPDVMEMFAKADADRMAEINEVFTTKAAQAGLEARVDFIGLEAADGQSLSAFARHFDLIVTAIAPETGEEHLAADPDSLTLYSGRPVLAVPDAFEAKKLSDHALIAWDGKRCAARALGDAMDVLEDKARVSVLEVGKEEVPGTDILLRNLKRHGIDAELVRRPRHRSIAQTVLETTEEVGAQLIVMGAFEHSRFQHNLIGGVTTDVMAQSKVPVFLSH